MSSSCVGLTHMDWFLMVRFGCRCSAARAMPTAVDCYVLVFSISFIFVHTQILFGNFVFLEPVV